MPPLSLGQVDDFARPFAFQQFEFLPGPEMRVPVKGQAKEKGAYHSFRFPT